MRAPAGLLLPLFCFLLPGALPARGPARPWKGFQVILWAFRDPAPPGLAETLGKLGVTALNCEFGIPSPWVKASGLPFYVGHAAGKGFLYMRERNWKAVFDPWYKTRDPSLLARRPCLSDPKAFGGARGRLVKTLSRLPEGRALALSLDDEISATRFIDPIDFCRSPHCLAAFRAWLREKYGSLKTLSASWGRKISSWEEVFPPLTDRVREASGRSPYPPNLARWNDHLAFRDHLLADRVRRLLDVERKLAPGLPGGFLGGQAPAAWGGYDWSLLAPPAGFVEAYDIGGARDVVASFASPGTKRVETLFLGPDFRLDRARFYSMMAHGLSGAILWSSRKLLDPRGKPTRVALEMAPAFRKASGPLGRALAGSRPAPGPWNVALLESQASVRLHWWKDSLADGKTWPRRFGSFEAKHSTSMATRVSWIRLVEDLGFQPLFLSEKDLEEGALRGGAGAPRLLVLPRTVALGGGACRAVEDFVRAGGVLVADGETALYDDSLHRRREGALDGLFGIRRPADPSAWVPCDRNGRALASAFSPGGLPVLQRGIAPSKGTSCKVTAGVNWAFSARRGRGRTFYWNLSFCAYARARETSRPAPGVLLARELLGEAARAAGIEPPFGVEIRAKPLSWIPLERMERISPGGKRLWLFRVNLGKKGLDLVPSSEPLAVRLFSRSSVSLRRLGDGKALKGTRAWTCLLDPPAFQLFEVAR